MGKSFRPTAAFSTLSAIALVVILIIFLGALTGRFSLARSMENIQWMEPLVASGWTWFLISGQYHGGYGPGASVDLLLFAVLAVLLIGIGFGAVSVLGQEVKTEPDSTGRRHLPRAAILSRAAAAFITAGAIATILELAGLWKKLVPEPDPLQEKGAPVWVWWILLAASLLVWFWPGRRAGQSRRAAGLARTVSIAVLAAIALTGAAVLLHATRPDPVQGRYYGIPGFVVGRQFSNEYGTYYGSAAGATAACLSLWALIVALRRR